MAVPTLSYELRFRSKRFADATLGWEFLADQMGKAGKDWGPIISTEMKRYLKTVTEALARRHGNIWPAGTTANSLSRRSGNLVNTLQNASRVKGSSIKDIVGEIWGPEYAKIQETGGTIRPRKSKYLAVPLPAALNSNGTPRYQSPRQWKNTFVLKSKKGNLLIVQKAGKNLIPLYVLKSSVKIPPRLNLEKTAIAALPKFEDELADKLVKALFDE